MIYTADGRTVRRKVGFCDDPFEIIAEDNNSDQETVSVDLIGSSFSYWSETEERTLDQDKVVLCD